MKNIILLQTQKQKTTKSEKHPCKKSANFHGKYGDSPSGEASHVYHHEAAWMKRGALGHRFGLEMIPEPTATGTQLPVISSTE